MAKATEQQIEQWKKEYGDVKEIALDDPSDKDTDQYKYLYLKKPKRPVLKMAMSKMSKPDGTTDAIASGDVIITNCHISGWDDIKEDDKYYFRACIEATGYLQECIGFF